MAVFTEYDKDADERNSPEALKKAESQAATDAQFSRMTSPSNYKKNGTEPTAQKSSRSKADSSDELDEKESTPDQVGNGFKPTKKRKFLGKVSSLRKKKWLLIGGGMAGVSIGGFIIFLILIGSAFKIPNLASHIVSWQFARTSRQFAQSAQRVTNSALAVQAADDATYTGIKARYLNLRNNTWGKLDAYRPAIAIKNFRTNTGFQLGYSAPTKLGRQVLTSVTFDNETYKVVQQGGTRFVPGLSSIIQFRNNATFAKDFAPAVSTALHAYDIGPIIRYKVAASIRQELGISLLTWKLGQFKGKTPTQADIEAARQRVQAVDVQTGALKNTATEPKTDNLKSAVQDSRNATTQALASDSTIEETIKNGGFIKSAQSSIASTLSKTGLDTAIGIFNPVYGVAMPICIVYDGSLDSSGPSIDQNSAQKQAAGQQIVGAANQLQQGVQKGEPDQQTELNTASASLSNTLGDTSGTNAEQRARGGTVDTSNTLGAQTSAEGDYTLLDATLPSGLATPLNAIADSVCPVATNTTVAIVGGVLSIAGAIVTLGGSAAVEGGAAATAEGVAEGATTVLQGRVANILTNLVGKYSTERAGVVTGRVTTALGQAGKGAVKSAGKVVAATLIAKLIVSVRSGQLNSGFAQSQDLANNADEGMGLTSQEIARRQEAGAPLLAADIVKSDATDSHTIGAANSSKSFYQRYFATSNADSLLNNMASTVSSDVNSSFMPTLLNIGTTLLRPLTYLGSILTSMTGSVSAAPAQQHYGDVQIGWTDAENNLIDTNESYQVVTENQDALDQGLAAINKTEGDIANTYGKCFGYKYNGNSNASMDPTDPDSALEPDNQNGTMGELLANGDILRDSSGNVINDPNATCSPINLGPTNPHGYGDLVFRWRLAISYGTTLNQLTSVQNVTNTVTNL